MSDEQQLPFGDDGPTDPASNLESAPRPDRRDMFAAVAALGIGSTVFQRALVAQAPSDGAITVEMIRDAEWISGITLGEAERKSLVFGMNNLRRRFTAMRKVPLPNDVPSALVFRPSADADRPGSDRGKVTLADGPVPKRPQSDEDLAFLSVADLARLVRTKQVSSTELTKLSIERLKKYDPALKCVVTLTEELALKQAAAADKEIAAGKYRGPLHGLPWGAKDLMAYPGYKTTWGASPYKDQMLAVKASVIERLENAGAVMTAKLTLGALAMGDQWFGGMTRNPWDVRIGSSGSSAGSASAVVAGLVAFAIGSETLGSIVSPCTRCGASGLRPSFGRVSRHGCMTLCWSMDKIGPIARSLEDCALVFGAIHGRDGRDASVVDRPFDWPGPKDLSALRVGYVENRKPVDERDELTILKKLGVQLVPIKLPEQYPVDALVSILDAECAAAFDELTRKGVTEGLNSWPGTFRRGQFIPAVEYIRANRIRSLLIREMDTLFEKVDLYVGGNDLVLTNFTGHPTAVLPSGFVKQSGTEVPSAITFTGRLFGETTLLAVADGFQREGGHHRRRPDMSKVVPAEPKK